MGYLELEEYLRSEALRVEQALDQVVTLLELELGSDISAVIRHGVMSRGKRLRPILCATAYRECGGRRESAVYDLAAAIEMIHAYSLTVSYTHLTLPTKA